MPEVRMPGEIPGSSGSPQAPHEETGASPVLSAEEVQRKLEQMTASGTFEASDLAGGKDPLIPEVKLPPKPVDPDKSIYKQINWESAPEIFDQMVSGIRKEREVQRRETENLQSKIDADWQHVLESMRELQRKVAGHRNLIYFTISRDQRDISIKLVDHTDKRGYQLLTLSRRHPQGSHPKLNVVWLIEFPAREWHFADAKEAMAEFVTRIAGSLA